MSLLSIQFQNVHKWNSQYSTYDINHLGVSGSSKQVVVTTKGRERCKKIRYVRNEKMLSYVRMII